MLANLWNLGGKRNQNAHSCPCVHEDEGCREQWSSLGGHVSGHQHATHHIISHQHHHHHYCKQFNHYYSIISSDAKYEVLKSQIFETTYLFIYLVLSTISLESHE